MISMHGHSHEQNTSYVHPHDARAERLTRRLAVIGFAWHLIEAVLAIYLGIAAGSIALLAFGLDSVIELFAGAVIIWRMSGVRAQSHAHVGAERRAARMIGVSFYVLAVYVAAHSVYALATSHQAGESIGGIILAIVTVLTMQPLAVAKRRAAQRAQSASAESEAQQTSLCVYLAIVMLAGLVLNAALGWWWADPAAALIIATLAVYEGRKIMRTGDVDCC